MRLDGFLCAGFVFYTGPNDPGIHESGCPVFLWLPAEHPEQCLKHKNPYSPPTYKTTGGDFSGSQGKDQDKN